MQLDLAALEPDLVVADAEPPDEPVAGVAGAVPGTESATMTSPMILVWISRRYGLGISP